jgi:transcriptional regulator with XRE-family HTH domain
MSEDRQALARRIREARERNGWTQQQVAGWAGLTPAQLSRYEAGTEAPGAKNLARLANGLRVTADWLLGLA